MSEVATYLKEERDQEWRVALRGQMKNKERTQLERVHMPEQDPESRNKNFTEVNSGLTEEQARHEARRRDARPYPGSQKVPERNRGDQTDAAYKRGRACSHSRSGLAFVG